MQKELEYELLEPTAPQKHFEPLPEELVLTIYPFLFISRFGASSKPMEKFSMVSSFGQHSIHTYGKSPIIEHYVKVTRDTDIRNHGRCAVRYILLTTNLQIWAATCDLYARSMPRDAGKHFRTHAMTHHAR